MTTMERVRFAKRIINWFYGIDPYNGCPEEDAWTATVQMLTDQPSGVVYQIAEYTGDPDIELTGRERQEAAAIIREIASLEAAAYKY